MTSKEGKSAIQKVENKPKAPKGETDNVQHMEGNVRSKTEKGMKMKAEVEAKAKRQQKKPW
ncbi:hypothetical protein AAVH_16279 [Aphelenchoides avenae]|nr:hypothetical protein AAVH_16279 [Aphelenchus avenae]